MKAKGIFLICAALGVSWPQNPPAPAAGRGAGRGMFGGAAVQSPEVAADGKVPFPLRDPDAIRPLWRRNLTDFCSRRKSRL